MCMCIYNTVYISQPRCVARCIVPCLSTRIPLGISRYSPAFERFVYGRRPFETTHSLVVTRGHDFVVGWHSEIDGVYIDVLY
jgi:hypothetical protein